jgi:hypothetical protein
LALKFNVTVDRSRWLQMIRDRQRPVATAAVAALQETSANAVQEGRRNIAAAGRFRGKWLTGLRYRMFDAEESGEPSLQARALIFHSLGIAGVFEHGATIEGQPLLWIPTDPNAPPASRSGKKLVSATVRGQPMLFDAGDRARDRKPLYIGVPAVRIPKKFRITEIVKQHAKQLGRLFIKHFKGD